jgi:hypothetical protein
MKANVNGDLAKTTKLFSKFRSLLKLTTKELKRVYKKGTQLRRERYLKKMAKIRLSRKQSS